MPEKEPINATSLAAALNPEYETRGQVEGLYDAATYVLQTGGVAAKINGREALISEQHTDVVVGDKKCYARIFQEGDRIGFAFDETPDINVTTCNANALYFSQLPLGVSLVADTAQEPVVDEPEHVALASQIIADLTEKSVAIAEKKAQQKAKEEQERAAQKKFAAEQRARVRAEKRHHIRRTATKGATVTVAVGMVGGALFGVVSAINGMPEDPVFDELNPAPQIETEPAVILEGNEGVSPMFAQELIDERVFTGTDSKIPELVDYHESSGYLDTDDTEALTLSHTFREVHVASSKPDKNCTTFEVQAPDGAEIHAWTDFRNPDELTVTYKDGTGNVCWNGEERDELDDPRIVLSLVADGTNEQPVKTND